MSITRYEPFGLINLLNHDLGHFAGHRARRFRSDAQTATEWLPPVDIVEEKDRFVLRADLPGVPHDAIDVRMEDGVLNISGERKRAAISAGEDDGEGARRFERSTGRFQRRFSLPDTADAEGIAARSDLGILEVVIPKRAEVQSRRITVEAA